MARVVIRCQHTGHYVFTGIDTERAPGITGGAIYCPYCATDHVWTCRDAKPRERPLIRQAG